ncbi:MAG: type II toxin-antitoxin system RelE/ParE family toxin [Lachnospiraceae bacterium]|nr:type II toxin-antitoxin system RelE/ParE family toxin [Lachnospiraceae bacterium]
MTEYKVVVTPDALEQFYQYQSYLLFVKRNEQAYDAVEEDYFKTIEELSRVAGSLQDPPEPELRERGLKRIHFLKHDYVMLYWIDGDECVKVFL